MRTTSMCLTLAAVTLGSATALAQGAEPAAAGAPATAPARESGVELGARLGYGIPMGDAVENGKLNEAFSGTIPIWLDVGYRVNPNIYAGVFFQYGIGMMNTDKCKDCTGSDMRFGINAQYHIMPAEKFDPWIGAGVGYEIATIKSSQTVLGQSFDASASYKGLEFINLQVGGDYKVSPAFGIGPFVSFSLGQYSSYSSEVNGKSDSGDIEKKAMHQWLTLGVRGTFGL